MTFGGGGGNKSAVRRAARLCTALQSRPVGPASRLFGSGRFLLALSHCKQPRRPAMISAHDDARRPLARAEQAPILYASLAAADPEVHAIVEEEKTRQFEGLELIASEVWRRLPPWRCLSHRVPHHGGRITPPSP